MRQAPRHIEKALKRHDRRLGVRWDQDARCWLLMEDGRDLFPLERNGKPIQGDLYEGEVMQIVQRCDQRSNPFDMSRAVRRQRYRQKAARDRAFERMVDERRPEAERRARFLASGPRPFVSGA